MYFPMLHSDGRLAGLDMVPLRIGNMRLHLASSADATWLADTLNRQAISLGTDVRIDSDQVLRLVQA
jgi:poly-gamma-glutamate synthesis protein (capsule biosynthesis protein)